MTAPTQPDAAPEVRASVEFQTEAAEVLHAADPASVAGTQPLEVRSITPPMTRVLLRVEGTSIKWFGVAMARSGSGRARTGAPLVFFTPSPWQGGYRDPDYDAFTRWRRLFDRYTWAMGAQLAASTAPMVLVIPFYRSDQSGSLGSFLREWRAVLKAVLTKAYHTVDPLALRADYRFEHLYAASFSNGIATQRNFVTAGAGVADALRMSYNLDGQASGLLWNATRSMSYDNVRPRAAVNPVGNHWYLGGRFDKLRAAYPKGTDHGRCPLLLLHALSLGH